MVRFCGVPIDEGPCGKRLHYGGPALACITHGGGKRCGEPTADGPCTKLAIKKGKCMVHAGNKKCERCGAPVRSRCRMCRKCQPAWCQFPGCAKKIQHGCESWCKLHFQARYCNYSDCNAVIREGHLFCQAHSETCRHPGCKKMRQSSSFCCAHGGGPHCKSEACVALGLRSRARFKNDAGIQICWGCFTAQYPERAKLKVRKEHLLLAELQRRMPWLGERATQLVWDCPVPCLAVAP